MYSTPTRLCKQTKKKKKIMDIVFFVTAVDVIFLYIFYFQSNVKTKRDKYIHHDHSFFLSSIEINLYVNALSDGFSVKFCLL